MDKHWKILLVEDDEDDYVLARLLLSESREHEVELNWVSTYGNAIEALSKNNYDVLLVDYILGDCNGLDLVREAISIGCRAPAIMLTGQGSYELDLQAMQSGAVDYLVKGQLSSSLLERTIRYAIERRNSQEALRAAHSELEMRVEERTQELSEANKELQLEIAERKRVESQLRIQTTALEAAANGIIITDAQGHIIWCNPAFSRMTGYQPEEVLGAYPNFLKSGKHDEQFYKNLWLTILDGKVWQEETINRRKDGSLYIEDQTITPVSDEHGQVTTFISIKQDITLRKQAEETIRKDAAHSEAVADISGALAEVGPDYHAVLKVVVQKIARIVGDACVVHLLSPDGIWLVPEALYHLTPSSSKLLDKTVTGYPHDAHAGVTGQVIKSGQGVLINDQAAYLALPPARREYVAYAKRRGISSILSVPMRSHGKIIGTLTVFRDGGRPELTREDQAFAQDVADRAALAIVNASLYRDLQASLQEEQTMRRQLVMAEKHSAMSRMVASVAHELNNPIQTIQNCLYLINQDIQPNSEMAGFISMATSEARRVSDLVSQLREVYRPSKSGPMQPLEVFKTIEEVHSLLVPHLQHEHVQWEQQAADDVQNAAFLGSADQIKQVFINICLNAIEAMQPDGGTLSLTVGRSEDNQQVWVKFKDTGPGISEHHLSQVFEPFFTTKDSGTGLGLSICYDIIQRHGGTITVESPLHQGAAFTVWLPLV